MNDNETPNNVQVIRDIIKQIGVRITDRYGRWIARGKDVKTGEWVVGVYMPIFEEIHFQNDYGAFDFRKIDPKTLGQRVKVSSHGHEDKFLFEGDVVDFGWIVSWVGRDIESQEGACTGMSIGWYTQRDDFSSWSEITIGEEYNVFGNIHDNPELPAKIREEHVSKQLLIGIETKHHERR